MTQPYSVSRFPFRSSSLVASLAFVLATGCKTGPVDDTTLANNVHSALTADSSIASEPVQASASQGSVTLTGNVSNDTARVVAAQDAAKVKGVKQVVNDLSVAGQAVAPTIVSPEAPTVAMPTTPVQRQAIRTHQPLPPPPVPVERASAAPSAPPPPAYRDVTVPAGTAIPVRITQTLSSETATDGQSFSGVTTGRIDIDGYVAIPAGTPVTGTVVEAKDATHFKGHSILSIALTGINRRGSRMPLSTEPYTLDGNNRGKNSAEKIGGGAAVGAILGGIFGGGKGAAIGAGVGGGGGAAVNGLSRGQQVTISSETVVRFRTTSSVTVRTYDHSEGADDDYRNSGLQERPNQ